MFDLHSHLLPGVDDGSPSLDVSLEMARMYAAGGVTGVVCTPHILPGIYHNSGPEIKDAAARMQTCLDDAGIGLKLFPGADNHVVSDFVAGLKRGHLLTLSDSCYVLVEPPHHVAPMRLEDFFFNIIVAGYIPVLTHPERLSWIESKYDLIKSLASKGVWMQITAGSLRGNFGRRALYWAERLLSEGFVHILATDAHDNKVRPPDLMEGRRAAERIVGAEEAEHLVLTRPLGVLSNKLPNELPDPVRRDIYRDIRGQDGPGRTSSIGVRGGLAERVRRLLG